MCQASFGKPPISFDRPRSLLWLRFGIEVLQNSFSSNHKTGYENIVKNLRVLFLEEYETIKVYYNYQYG